MSYHLVNVTKFHPDQVQLYWQTLAQHDQLKDRWLDIEDPQWEDIKAVIVRRGDRIHHVVHDANPTQILGEFMLDYAIGRAAYLHFSSLPTITLTKRLRGIKAGSDLILANANIDALLGLTPTRYPHAVLVLKRAGWEDRGILRSAVRDHAGQYLDSHIMVYQ